MDDLTRAAGDAPDGIAGLSLFGFWASHGDEPLSGRPLLD